MCGVFYQRDRVSFFHVALLLLLHLFGFGDYGPVLGEPVTMCGVSQVGVLELPEHIGAGCT